MTAHSQPSDNAPLRRDPAFDGERIERAVAALLAARRGVTAVSGLPPDAAPRNMDEAYCIQRELTHRLGATIGGWKIAMDDARHGRSAPVFATDLHASPARLAVAPTARVGIEPEIAFLMARSLPPQAADTPYTRAQVIAAIGSAHAAIEIVISRFATHEGASALEQLADNISNGGLVLGPALPRWQELSIAAVPLRLQIGTRTAHEGRGGHPLGDPLLPLVWLVNHLATNGGPGLAAGQVVTTGSCAGLHYLEPGGRAVVEFHGLGTVVLERG